MMTSKFYSLTFLSEKISGKFGNFLIFPCLFSDILETLGTIECVFYISVYYTQPTVKLSHAVTSIKQPPVLKGHPFLVLT